MKPSWRRRTGYWDTRSIYEIPRVYPDIENLAKSNAEQVEKAIRLAYELGLEVATPDDARKMLGLKGLDKVNF